MASIWMINQHANTPEMPGHTRQFELAKGLVEKGWVIEIFSSDFNLSKRKFFRLKNFQISKKETIDGIIWNWLRVFPYKTNNWKRYINILSFSVHIFIKLFIKGFSNFKVYNHPDIIFASSPQLPAALIGLIISKIFNKPFVVEIRDLWPQVLIDQGGKNQKDLIVKTLLMMEKFVYKNSINVIVLAKGSKEFVTNRGAKNVTWLPNGPDLEQFKSKPIPKNIKYKASSPFKIFYTGSHGEANALHIVIDAARLIQDWPIEIVLLGDGPEKSNLIKYAKDLKNVSFRDPISKKNIPFVLEEADAILLTLKKVKLFEYGVSPNKLYDAYAISRPVITNVPGDINNEVENYKLGTTALPDNPEDLASAIKKLFMTPLSEREKMAKRARKLAELNYSRAIIINKYNKIFSSLLTSNNG